MQVSHILRALPVVLCLAPPVRAQTNYRVTNEGEWFHQTPDGRRLARLARGAVVLGGPAQGDWMQVTMQGWIFATSVGPTPREGFDLVVTHAPEENLRADPGGTIVAKLAEGFLLSKMGADDRWVRVRRDGWVKKAALEPVAQVASAASGSAGSAPDTTKRPAGDTNTVDPGRAQPARRTTLFRAPDGPATGAIAPATPLRVLGRSGEWSRVQFEAWVKSSDLQSAPPGVLVGVSAAELRADPQRYIGQVLQWTLQYVALQTADELRPDLPAGASYMLARGPLPERGFVYVMIPEARRAAVAALAPLATVKVTARVRAGRSRFIGNPVVDLLSLEAQP